MLETYEGILRGNRIEWSRDAPPSLPQDVAVRVHVTLLDKVEGVPSESSQGKRMVAALARLAASERERRQDRPLPERDE